MREMGKSGMTYWPCIGGGADEKAMRGKDEGERPSKLRIRRERDEAELRRMWARANSDGGKAVEARRRREEGRECVVRQ